MMTLVPYNPMVTGRLWRDMFDDSAASAGFLRANVREQKDAYVVEAEIPGVKKEDVVLICEQGVLTISVNVKAEPENEENRCIRKERPEGEMIRRFAIEGIDEENISAKLDSGVLYVTLPKKGPDERRIAID